MNIWSPSPLRTEYGDGMVVLDVELDKDHTLTLICEADQLHLVNTALIKLSKEEHA